MRLLFPFNPHTLKLLSGALQDALRIYDRLLICDGGWSRARSLSDGQEATDCHHWPREGKFVRKEAEVKRWSDD